MTTDAKDPVERLRDLTKPELIQEGEEGLMAHLIERARHARVKHGGLSPRNLEAFLADRECARFPTRLVFEYGEMAMHQFAQPERDYRAAEESYMLYLRPELGRRPDLLPLAIAYMLPLINYGEIVNDEHCLAFGAELLGMTQEAYYEKVCEMADHLGAERRSADEEQPPPKTEACSCLRASKPHQT